MLSFEVILNDETLCTAGLYDEGVLNVMLNASKPESKIDEPAKVDLNVGGLIGNKHVRWVDGYGKLRVGDTVAVRVVEAESDPPRRVELRINEAGEHRLGAAQAGGQCNFCGKRESEVRKLLDLGVPELICDECIHDAIVRLRREGLDTCESDQTA